MPGPTQTTTPLAPPRDASLPAVAGWPFLLTALLGRMPSAMVQLGYLMVLARDGRGLATAGLAVAFVGLGTALGAPVVGRLVDRHGPAPVLASATALSLAGQAAFLVALLLHAPSAVLLACATLVGAANPQIGAVARARWSVLATRRRDPRLVSRALGYEGAVDEGSFVVGPVLASLLVSVLGAAPAVVAIAAATLAAQGLFLAHLWRHRDGWRPERGVAAGAADGGRVDVLAAALAMVAVLGVGTLFGATQTGLTNLFQLRGTEAFTGLVYGTVGIGSAFASVVTGRLHRIPVGVRVLVGSVAAGVAGWLLTLLPTPAPAFGVALLLGVGAGLMLVSSFAWMEAVAPRRLLATMMTLMSTCVTLGVSVGAAVAGWLSDLPSRAFAPVVVAGVLSALAGVAMGVLSRRRAA